MDQSHRLLVPSETGQAGRGQRVSRVPNLWYRQLDLPCLELTWKEAKRVGAKWKGEKGSKL